MRREKSECSVFALVKANSHISVVLLQDLEDASTIFAVGASIDLAMEDCFIRTRNWLMDVYDMLEEETIALSKSSIDMHDQTTVAESDSLFFSEYLSDYCH